MKNIRVGDRICCIYHMSNKGRVSEVYSVPVKSGNGAGPFSKTFRVKFLSELDGKVYDLPVAEVMKEN